MKKTAFIIILLLCFTTTNASAYTEGDSIPPEVMEKISTGKKVTIVEFFASWCHSCKIELPLIVKLYDGIDKSKYDIVGVDIDENFDNGVTFQKMLKLNFKVINDNKQELVSKFKPGGMPALFYIVDNKVLKIREGAIDNIDQVILSDLEKL